jgi:uncharacterized protein YfaS (alpha-2-macroglobulin family)
MPLDLQLNYINGGAAANQAVQVSSLLRSRSVNIAGYDGFSFDAPRNDDDSNADDQKIVADKLAVTLDKNGAGRAVIGKLPALQRPQELLTEMTYSDPNGEVQTISNVTPLWPSAVVVGLRTGNWVSVKKAHADRRHPQHRRPAAGWRAGGNPWPGAQDQFAPQAHGRRFLRL